MARKAGRPGKTKGKKCRGNQKLEDITNVLWSKEKTKFGEVYRGPNHETLLPPGMFEKIEEEYDDLLKSKSNQKSVCQPNLRPLLRHIGLKVKCQMSGSV